MALSVRDGVSTGRSSRDLVGPLGMRLGLVTGRVKMVVGTRTGMVVVIWW